MQKSSPDQPMDPLLLPPPPTNDNCANAISLSVGAACVSGSTNTATTQVGEYLCINPGGGITPETVWYRFTATNSSMVLGVVQTNTTNCATVLAVYGPFAPGGGCLPGSGNQILCQNMGLIDPGFHPLLTGLTVGQSYLVQVQGNNCGGGNDRFTNFCVSINDVSTNSVPGGASVINNCGVAFTGGTTGGHYASGTSIGANNLDNNNATSIAGASEVGDDVTFVINNASWFTFCNGNAGSCNWSINLNGISNCLLSGLNAGVQAAVFTGTPAALTNVAISPSRVAPGGSWGSGTFAVGAGQCAYVMVDGFAGDECDYNLTLTNLSCPCLVLPIEMAYMTGSNFPDYVQLDWQMNAEDDLQNFIVERSADGIAFSNFSDVLPNTRMSVGTYTWKDESPLDGWNYYRLSARDLEGNISLLGTISVMRMDQNHLDAFANLSDSELNLIIQSPERGDAEITLTDPQGRIVLHNILSLEESQSKISLSTGPISAGVYIMNLSQGGKTVTKRVMKF